MLALSQLLLALVSHKELMFLPLFSMLVFWGLDAYYLRQDRLFREIYKSVHTAPKGVLRESILSMDTGAFVDDVDPWVLTIFDPKLLLFHGVILAGFILFFVLRF